MDITTIDAASFATRVGQVAAAQLAALLTSDDETIVSPVEEWFSPGVPYGPDEETLAQNIEALGAYVCQRGTDRGETLFLYGQQHNLVPRGPRWIELDFPTRQAFETFVSTVHETYLGIAAAQKAVLDARRLAGLPAPEGLKREDSIFEEVESLGTLRPEAVEASKLMARYGRELAAESARLSNGNSEPFSIPADAERHETASPETPAPLSVGEAVAKPPVNRGGRGRKKAP